MNPLLSYAAPLVGAAVVGASLLAIPLPTPKTPAEYAELAIIYLKLKDPRAADYFAQALAADPKDVRAHYGAGVAAFEGGSIQDAEMHLKAVIDADPKHVDAMYNLAVVYQKTKRSRDMEAMLKKVTEIEPKDSRAWEDLAQLEIRRRNYKEARGYLEKYLELMPKRAKKQRARAEAKIAKIDKILGDRPAATPSATPVPKKTP